MAAQAHEPGERTPEAVLADLERVADGLIFHLGEADRLYVERDALYVEGREGFEKPITQSRIAGAAKVKDGALVASLRKIGERRGRKVR